MMFSNEYCESFKSTIFIEHLCWFLNIKYWRPQKSKYFTNSKYKHVRQKNV